MQETITTHKRPFPNRKRNVAMGFYVLRYCIYARPLPVSRLVMVLITLLMSLFLTTACQETITEKQTNYAECLECHKGIERISSNHDFKCVSCHIKLNSQDPGTLTTHEPIIRNPSDPEHVNTFCLPCHEKEVRQFGNSLHSSMAGIINQTRYLWGAQKTSIPAVYGLSGIFQPLPEPDPVLYPETPASLVDDFLRRRCLRCHIHTRGPGGRGLYRATGCAACHMLYNNDGCYHGSDQAVAKNLTGYPARHEFTKIIPDVQCLHCHNQNHVGADYEGFFEHDYSSTYRSPIINGRPVSITYGMDYHHLARDIHAEKGLWCTDCHTKNDVMGGEKIYSFEMDVKKRSCTGCHGNYDNPTPDLSYRDICQVSGKFFFVSKNNGKRYPLSLFSRGPVAHSISAHRRVRCGACHAQWAYQDYGMSVIREDLLEGYKWYHLTAQGDPYLQKILETHLENPVKSYPVSKDWISGEVKPGIWSMGWRFRRWELMPLGVDHTGRYAIIRPLYQYLISYVDRLGYVPLDSAIPSRGDSSGSGWAYMPYVPHTVAPYGRQCDSCHLNSVAAGSGIQDAVTVDTNLTVPSKPAVKGMRLLNTEERKKLLKPSKKWRKQRLRALTD